MIFTKKSWLFKLVFLLLFILASNFSYSQEICNNGIDDDGDGLIDLNDAADCNCPPTPIPSIIPNSSFEQMNCCPSSISQMYCATGWIQASTATSDYMNTCGFVFGAATNAGLVPFPDGNGIVGTIFHPGWQEYVGSCLSTPMIAGSQYQLNMNIASTPVDGLGGVCNGGVINYGPIDIVIYGAASCASLPFVGTGCPPAPWQVIATATYTPTSSWSTLSLTFTPTFNVAAIIIGSPCSLPASYPPPGGCLAYFYYDNLVLNLAASWNNITQTGTWCDNNVQLIGKPVAGATYQWYKDGVALIGQTGQTLNISANGLPPGNYSLLIDSAGTCSISSDTVIQTSTVADFTSTSVCQGLPTTFTDNSTNPSGPIDGWQWDFGDNIGTSTAQNPTYTYTNPGTYTVTLIASSGICYDTIQKNVTVYPSPSSNFGFIGNPSNPNGVCLGNIVSFIDSSTISSGSITDWSWDFGEPSSGVNNSSILQNPTHNYAMPGNYNVTLTVTSNNGCIHDTIIPVEVYSNPIALFSADTACLGFNTTFTDLSISGSGGSITNWSWDFNNDNIPDDFTQNPSFILPNSGLNAVTLFVTDSSGCMHDTTININVSAQPTADFTFNNVCFGTTTTFTDLSLPNGGTITTWNWDFTNDGTVDSNTQNPTNGYPSSGSYVVELQITTALGCVDSITKTVIVNPVPVVNFGFTEVCLNTPTNFYDSTQINAPGTLNTWSWDFGDNIGTSALQNPNYTYLTSGTFNVSLTVTSDSGCVNTIVLPVSVFPNPTAAFTTADVCQNLAAQFNSTASNGNGGIINQWDWDFDFIAPLHTTDDVSQNPSQNYSAPGTYTVELIVTTQTGCSDTVQHPITIYPKPNADYTFTDECFGTAIDFMDNSNVSSGNITNWNWNFGNNNTSVLQNPSELYANAGQYNVTLIVTTDNNCKDTLTKTVNVWPLPEVDFISTDVCLLDTTSFTDLSVVSTGTNVAWNWNFDDGTNSNHQHPTHTYSHDGVFQVQLIVTTNYGCVDSITKPVMVYPLPQVNFVADVVDGCSPVIVNFTDNSVINAPGSNVSWQWNFGDAGTSSQQNPTVSFVNSSNTSVAIFGVSLTVTSDKGCVGKDSIANMISSYPIPLANFTYGPDPTNIYNSEISFTDNSIIASQWLWDFGDGSSSSAQHPVHAYADSGLYNVILYIENIYGCKDTIQDFVKIDPVFALWIPNTFTPDGDNTNDLFFAKGYGITQLETQIFDRWGELIFEGNQVDSKWDGTYNGTLAQTGVYIYKIRAKDIFNKWHEFVGHVNLLR